jgi:hypothetical protein
MFWIIDSCRFSRLKPRHQHFNHLPGRKRRRGGRLDHVGDAPPLNGGVDHKVLNV